MISTMRCAVNLATLLLLLSLPLSAETILDDDFAGDTLDTDIWEYHPWSTGTVSLHDSRIHFEPDTTIQAYNTYGLNYVNMHLFGVEGAGFGFGLESALGGWAVLGVDTDHNAALSFGPNFRSGVLPYENIERGTSSDGDFQIIWTPTLFQVINNGDVLFSRDDPIQIPYYEYMGPFSLWSWDDGSLSLDRVVLTIPEPATLSMLSLSLFLLRFSYRRRKP